VIPRRVYSTHEMLSFSLPKRTHLTLTLNSTMVIPIDNNVILSIYKSTSIVQIKNILYTLLCNDAVIAYVFFSVAPELCFYILNLDSSTTTVAIESSLNMYEGTVGWFISFRVENDKEKFNNRFNNLFKNMLLP
jgi:hypothetical protein